MSPAERSQRVCHHWRVPPIYFICTDVLSACLSTTWVTGICRVQKRALDLLGVELQTVASTMWVVGIVPDSF